MAIHKFSDSFHQSSDEEKSLQYRIGFGLFLIILIGYLLNLSLMILGAHSLHTKIGQLINSEGGAAHVSLADLKKLQKFDMDWDAAYIKDKAFLESESVKLTEFVDKKKTQVDEGEYVWNSANALSDIYPKYCDYVVRHFNVETEAMAKRKKFHQSHRLSEIIPSEKETAAEQIFGQEFGRYYYLLQFESAYPDPFLSVDGDNNSKAALPKCTGVLKFPKEYTIKYNPGVQAAYDEFRYYASGQNVKDGVRSFGLDAFLLKGLIYKPQEILTMTLVVIMGMLGAALRVTNSYMDSRGKQKAANYFFLPLLGGATGFAVFITAHAGVLVLTDYGISEGEATLSPYLVSLLGLSAGLATNEALDAITSIGRRIFRSSAHNIHRWFIGPKEHAANDALLGLIANITEVPNDRVKQWFTGLEPVPNEVQKIIALQLKEDQRQLFTDIAPFYTPPVPKDDDEPDPIAP